MTIRHVGIFVRDIDKVCDILKRLGFDEVYNVEENIGKVVKFKIGPAKFELIQHFDVILNTFHICIDGDIPEFMMDYPKMRYTAFDPNLLVDFVYIDDSIYFEFVRNKNDI